MAYDLFISYRHLDAAPVRALADGLRTVGLRVWIDERRIEDLTSIQTAITEGLTHAKALVAWYSQAYPESRPCQWEFTAAFLPALAAGQALERILIINPAGTPNHIHPKLYRDQKYLIPAGEDVTGLVKAIQRHVAGLTGSFGELVRSGSLTPRPDWYVRQATSAEYFTGRLRELWRIHEALHADQYPVIYARTPGLRALVVGLGGMGKSLLAEEYGLRFASQYPGGIFWLNARDVMDGQLAGFAEKAGIVIEGLKPADVRAAVGRHLQKAGQPYLWIVDDLPASLNELDFQACLSPESTLARTLITTRSHEYEGRGTEIALEELTPAEALSLLTRQIQPEGAEEKAAAERICEDLGGHPLALDVASRALKSFTAQPRFTQYHERLNQPNKDELEFAASLKGRLPNGHEKSIAATLLNSYTGLSEDAKTLLRLATELARAPIPVNLAVSVLAQIREALPEDLEDDLRSGLDELIHRAFARLDAAGTAFQPHVLVTRTVRFKDSLPKRQQALHAAAIATLQPILEASGDIRQHAALAPYMPHARYLTEQPADELEALLASWVVQHDYVRGDYRRARALQEQVLAVRRWMLGEDHPATLGSMANLAETLRAQGELAGARALQEQVLAVSRRVLGEDHPETLRSMSNLAGTLHAQGELAGARTLQEQVLAVRRRVLGEDHPNTLTSMANLAETLHAQGELAGARALQEQVLAVSRRVLGEDHPDTLAAMNNLAETLRAQGELAGVRALQEQVLAASRRVLGEDHPATLTSMNNLAATLRAQGELAGARTLHEQALALSRRVLGENHPDTTRSVWNLFLTLLDLQEWDAAREILMNHLAWLFQADPQALSFEQQQILGNLQDMFQPEQS